MSNKGWISAEEHTRRIVAAVKRRLTGEPPPPPKVYLERGPGSKRTLVCWNCRYVGRSGYTCPHCQGPLEMLSHRARVPKKTASDREWRRFRTRFGRKEESK